MIEKPETAAGYRVEHSEQVIAACLLLATTLGDLTGELCIVGGLVPSVICGTRVDPSALHEGAHVGTTDLDVALEVSVLDAHHYREIAARLRAKGFEADRKDGGALTRQRWRWRERRVTIDFLMPPRDGAGRESIRIQSLESDFAALIVKPLGLAFDEPVERTLGGRTLQGDEVVRTMRFCGPAAFVLLKAYALSLRGTDKDAYDLVYVLRRWEAGLDDVAARMAAHADRHPLPVSELLTLLDGEFASEEALGPRAASRFHDGTVVDARVADAYGAVRDLLDACRRRGVRWQQPARAA